MTEPSQILEDPAFDGVVDRLEKPPAPTPALPIPMLLAIDALAAAARP